MCADDVLLEVLMLDILSEFVCVYVVMPKQIALLPFLVVVNCLLFGGHGPVSLLLMLIVDLSLEFHVGLLHLFLAALELVQLFFVFGDPILLIHCHISL